MNPELTRITTSDYRMPADTSPMYKTTYLISRKTLRHLAGNQWLSAPHIDDRKWLERDTTTYTAILPIVKAFDKCLILKISGGVTNV